MLKIAINGFGRIGRAVMKLAVMRPELEVVAINDLGDIENLAYLLRYDSAYRRSGLEVQTEKTDDGKQFLIVNNKRIAFIQEKDPALLPWKDLGVDVAVESTGFFESFEKASLHIQAGARRAVITAPAKGDPTLGKTILIGVNEHEFPSCTVSSNGSCTTNSVSPIAQIMQETLGVKKAVLNTIHGYTATQKLVDSPDAKDWRRGRAGAQNIVPSSTGAAISVAEAVPGMKGLFDGIALRVPVITGSMVDFTFVAGKETSVEEVNNILEKASHDPRWSKVFSVTTEQLVSSDIIGSPYASIADLSLTKVIGGDLVKIMAWYDNEMGYTYALIEHIIQAGSTV